MLVILKETTRKLGKVGDVVKVAPGYARNWLLRFEKAERATKANLAKLESKKESIRKQQEAELQSAKKLADAINAIDVLPIFAQVEEGRLFGSIGVKNIAVTLANKGIEIQHKNIILPALIKEAGQHNIKICLNTDIECNLTIHILDVSKQK